MLSAHFRIFSCVKKPLYDVQFMVATTSSCSSRLFQNPVRYFSASFSGIGPFPFAWFGPHFAFCTSVILLICLIKLF
uniref:Uncharacterized protein n=1 Tax=Octopus bimaculoides TaxID=37653 RepID=A0A0L8FJI3_OCTBM